MVRENGELKARWVYSPNNRLNNDISTIVSPALLMESCMMLSAGVLTINERRSELVKLSIAIARRLRTVQERGGCGRRPVAASGDRVGTLFCATVSNARAKRAQTYPQWACNAASMQVGGTGQTLTQIGTGVPDADRTQVFVHLWAAQSENEPTISNCQ